MMDFGISMEEKFQSAKKSPLANTITTEKIVDVEGMFQSAKKSPLANTGKL